MSVLSYDAPKKVETPKQDGPVKPTSTVSLDDGRIISPERRSAFMEVSRSGIAGRPLNFD